MRLEAQRHNLRLVMERRSRETQEMDSQVKRSPRNGMRYDFLLHSRLGRAPRHRLLRRLPFSYILSSSLGFISKTLKLDFHRPGCEFARTSNAKRISSHSSEFFLRADCLSLKCGQRRPRGPDSNRFAAITLPDILVFESAKYTEGK